MKEIPLTQGKVALVDDADYEMINQWKWYYSHGYAVRNLWLNGGKRQRIHMHRLLADAPADKLVDHINRNPLDNRRGNLRLCTNGQNLMNGKVPSTNKSGYRGVNMNQGKWVARIKINGKAIHLGVFTDKRDAARAYQAKARELFGEFCPPENDLKVSPAPAPTITEGVSP